MMKIIVNGAMGHMGRIVCEKLAAREEFEIAARVDKGATEEGVYAALTDYSGEADCVIDFSNHAATEELLAYCTERSLPVVLATTGHTEEEKQLIAEASKKTAVFYAANMSVGIAVLADLAKRAAARFPDADIEIIEWHHNRKLDAPSGTALMLAEAIRQERGEAVLHTGRSGYGKRDPKEIGLHAVRAGNETGMHEILISNGNETLTLTHKAESRALFADGALTAALFLNKKAPGLYGMGDMMKE